MYGCYHIPVSSIIRPDTTEDTLFFQVSNMIVNAIASQSTDKSQFFYRNIRITHYSFNYFLYSFLCGFLCSFLMGILEDVLRVNFSDGGTKHKVVLFKFRILLPDLGHFSVDTVYSFAKLADILKFVEHLSNLGIAREVSGTQISNPHHARKDAWALESETVGENLDLYVGSEDRIVAVGYSIKLCSAMFLFRVRTAPSTLQQLKLLW